MNEFIEKLITRLEEVYKDDICDLIPNCDEFKNCKDCRKEFIKKIIEPILEEHNGGWIPVSERLPEDDSFCIVTVEYQNDETTEVDYGWFDRFGCCWYVGIQEFRTSNILAWMPLPPAFKLKGE